MGTPKPPAPPAPPDLNQCQAEKPNGHSFMTLGGSPGRVRCSAKSAILAIENKPGKNGYTGSMSLCADCLEVFQKQMPLGYATFKIIGEKK